MATLFELHARERSVLGEVQRRYVDLCEIDIDFAEPVDTANRLPINDRQSQLRGQHPIDAACLGSSVYEGLELEAACARWLMT